METEKPEMRARRGKWLTRAEIAFAASLLLFRLPGVLLHFGGERHPNVNKFITKTERAKLLHSDKLPKWK